MTNSRMNPKVDEFLSKTKQWQEEFEKFRMIKQSKTRASKVEKWLQQILNGKGLNEGLND